MSKHTSVGRKVNLHPLSSHVVVERAEAEVETRGGVLLPDTLREKVGRGSVVGVGPGKLSSQGGRTPLQVKLGDQVVFASFAGSELEIGKQKFVVMREDEILAILE